MASRRALIPVTTGTCHVDRAPERLVCLGFRCALTCLRPSEPGVADAACALLCQRLAAHGLAAGDVDPFLAWGLAVEAGARRPLAILPLDCLATSQDETLAVALVAAAQHDRCPALAACAAALLGVADDGRVLATTRTLAHRLAAADQRLMDRRVGDATAAAGRHRMGPGSERVH